MFTLFLTIEPYIQSIRPRARVGLSPRSPGGLKETLHRRRMLPPLLVVLSFMIVPVVTRAPPSTISPLEPTAVSTVGPSPNPVLPSSEQGVGSVNPRGMPERN